MKKSDITDIVDELIELEPSLTEHRTALKKNVEAIIKAKPTVKITPAFKKKLLSDLKLAIASQPQPLSLFTRMQKFFYTLGGAAVASIALYVTVINPMIPVPMPTSSDSDGMMMDENMAMQKEQAMEMGAMNAVEPAMMPRPQSGGGGDHTIGYGGGGGIPPMADSRMIAPGEPYPGSYTAVEYVYDGEIKLPEASALKTVKRKPLKSSTKANLLSGTFVADMMNVSKLTSLNVVNVSLSETGDEPLMVNVDFNDGNISINRQINYNLRPESKCRDEECFQRYRVKKSDMLSDARTIEIATEFVKNLGIDTSAYGKPVMQDDWLQRYEQYPDKSNFYFPEQVSVTFPYLVNGSPVYDEWGNANGMSVNVDVRLRAGIGLWGLRTMDLELEDVEAVADPEVIREIVRIGGINSYISPDAELKTARLGAPELVYVTQYQWDEDTQQGYELYIPALHFPVNVIPENTYEYRKAVVVPISSQAVENRPTFDDPPIPMPMERLEEKEMMEY